MPTTPQKFGRPIVAKQVPHEKLSAPQLTPPGRHSRMRAGSTPSPYSKPPTGLPAARVLCGACPLAPCACEHAQCLRVPTALASFEMPPQRGRQALTSVRHRALLTAPAHAPLSALPWQPVPRCTSHWQLGTPLHGPHPTLWGPTHPACRHNRGHSPSPAPCTPPRTACERFLNNQLAVERPVFCCLAACAGVVLPSSTALPCTDSHARFLARWRAPNAAGAHVCLCHLHPCGVTPGYRVPWGGTAVWWGARQIRAVLPRLHCTKRQQPAECGRP